MHTWKHCLTPQANRFFSESVMPFVKNEHEEAVIARRLIHRAQLNGHEEVSTDHVQDELRITMGMPLHLKETLVQSYTIMHMRRLSMAHKVFLQGFLLTNHALCLQGNAALLAGHTLASRSPAELREETPALT